jgi:hypothetical protein
MKKLKQRKQRLFHLQGDGRRSLDEQACQVKAMKIQPVRKRKSNHRNAHGHRLNKKNKLKKYGTK